MPQLINYFILHQKPFHSIDRIPCRVGIRSPGESSFLFVFGKQLFFAKNKGKRFRLLLIMRKFLSPPSPIDIIEKRWRESQSNIKLLIRLHIFSTRHFRSLHQSWLKENGVQIFVHGKHNKKEINWRRQTENSDFDLSKTIFHPSQGAGNSSFTSKLYTSPSSTWSRRSFEAHR